MATRQGFIAGAGALAAGAGASASAAFGAAPSGGTPLVPTETLVQRLLDGNKRFVAGKLQNFGDSVAERRQQLTSSQAPFAAIVSCADSRVIPELTFDLTIGDLFVTRVAGNFASDDILGSLEYAVEHLATRLIIVLGHENCGAVKAVYDAIAKHQPLPMHLDAIEHGMRTAIGPVVVEKGTLESAMRANVRATVTRISEAQPVIAPAVQRHRVQVVGAEYQLGTGAVHLLSRGA